MHIPIGPTRRLFAVVTAILVGLTGGTLTQMADKGLPHSPENPPTTINAGQRSDLAAVAIPTAARPTVRDTPTKIDISQVGGLFTANTAAEAVPQCPGCTAGAAALHVVTANKARSIESDNIARAHATCDECTAEAVSVQIVTGSRARTVTANNHAAAETTACTGCTSRAVAIQIVVVGGNGAPSAQTELDVERLQRKAEQQLRGLPHGQSARQGRVGADLADRIAAAVTEDIGGTAQQQVSIDIQ